MLSPYRERVSDLSHLALRIERNFAEHACHAHRRLPCMTVAETDDLVIADSGLDDDTVNIVAWARFDARSVRERIASTVGWLGTTGRPFTWWVGQGSTPVDLSDRLAKAGLPGGDTGTAMYLPLTDVVQGARTRGLDIRVVRTPTELAAFARVQAAGATPPSPTLPTFYALAADVVLGNGCAATYLLGYRDGEPVSTAEVFRSGDVAGIFGVCTLSAYRRRGFGTAMMTAATYVCRSLGVRAAVLQASKMGEPVYAAMGFRPVGTFVEHPFRPDAGHP